MLLIVTNSHYHSMAWVFLRAYEIWSGGEILSRGLQRV